MADVMDAYVDSSAGESDEEKDKDEDELAAEKKELAEQDQASLKHLESGAAQLESASEFKHKVLTTIKEKDSSNKRKLEKLEEGGGGYEETKSALMDKSGNKFKKGKHVSMAPSVTQDKKGTSIIASSSSGSSSSTTAVLSEENVRAYIKRQGGRVQIKVLQKEYKKAMKELGAAGKDTLKRIVIKLVNKEEDSVLGTMLVLK
jgi:hypothetical protein